MRIYTYNDVDNGSIGRTRVDDVILDDGDFGKVIDNAGSLKLVPFMPKEIGVSESILDYNGNNIVTFNAGTTQNVTFTYPLYLNSDPVDPLQAATKQYVDTVAAGGGFEFPTEEFSVVNGAGTMLFAAAIPTIMFMNSEEGAGSQITPSQIFTSSAQGGAQMSPGYIQVTDDTGAGVTRIYGGRAELGGNDSPRIAVEPNEVTTKAYVDAAIAAGGGGGEFLSLSGGTVNGQISLTGGEGQPLTPTEASHVTVKNYVDTEIATAVAPLAILPKLTLNLQTSLGNIITDPVIANALATIGTINGFTINLGFGEYREPGPIVIDNKFQLQIVGPAAANTTAATIKNGVTIQNSNGVRFLRVQVEGTSSIQSRTGLGQQFERTQFMGNVTLSGTGGFMMFTDCEFGGNVTIDAAFAGTIYFVRCSFSASAGVYTFNQNSPLQVIMSDCSGIPNAGIAKASFSGMATYKAGTQALFVNGLPLMMSGTTAQRPTTAMTGFMFFDTTLGRPVWRNGTSWRDATGATV